MATSKKWNFATGSPEYLAAREASAAVTTIGFQGVDDLNDTVR